MADDGVITQDTAVFTIFAKNQNIFEDQDVIVYIVPKTKSNYWYKLCKSIDRFRKKFKYALKILQIFVSHINNCIYLQLFLKNGSYNIKLK